MSDESTVEYLVPVSLTRRLNAWLRTQGFEPPRGFRRLRAVSLPGREETVSCSVVGLFCF
jgi:hypothetical protein